MKILSNLICISVMVTGAVPAMAWTRSSTAAADAARAEAAALTMMQTQARMRSETMARIRAEQLAHYRLNAMLRADALAASQRRIEATKQAARAQAQLAPALPPLPRQQSPFAAYVPNDLSPADRKLVGAQPVRQRFQGVVPADELKRVEPVTQRAPKSNGKSTHARAHGAK